MTTLEHIECRICKNKRAVVKDSDRDKQKICGECWNW